MKFIIVISNLKGVEGFDFVTPFYFPPSSEQHSIFEEAFRFSFSSNDLMFSFSNVLMTVIQLSNSALD